MFLDWTPRYDETYPGFQLVYYLQDIACAATGSAKPLTATGKLQIFFLVSLAMS